MNSTGKRPIVGITTDIAETPGRLRAQAGLAYAQSIAAAGGTPVMLPPIVDSIPDHLALCHAFVFTGGDDPRMEPFGDSTHPKATLMNALRQEYEMRLLALLDERRETPVLGICLGMQLMSLHAGGRMDQHMPDTMGAAAATHNGHDHAIIIAGNINTPLRAGTVHSHHKQRITQPGRLQVLATAPDGVIEAVGDPTRAFYLGVQWHPERTTDPSCGVDVFRSLIAAARNP